MPANGSDPAAVLRANRRLGSRDVHHAATGSGALQHRGIGFEDCEMGAEAEGDMMKTQEEDMQTEFRASQIGEAINLGIEPAFDQEAIALLAYFYWEARGC